MKRYIFLLLGLFAINISIDAGLGKVITKPFLRKGIRVSVKTAARNVETVAKKGFKHYALETARKGVVDGIERNKKRIGARYREYSIKESTLKRVFTRIVVRSKNQYISAAEYTKRLADPEVLAKMKYGYPKDAKILRDNMLTSMKDDAKFALEGIENGNYAHHIVGNATKKANAKLSKYGIDINDPINGIFLPSSSSSGLKGAVHRGGHTMPYYKYVDDVFNKCSSKEDCLKTLDKIKQELYEGKIVLNAKHGSNTIF